MATSHGGALAAALHDLQHIFPGEQRTSSDADAGALGKPVVDVPLGWRAQFGGGLRHVGSAYVNTANTIRIPGHWIADALVEYPINSHLSLRANVYNVTDESYVRSVNNNGARYLPGYSRSALVTLSLRP